MSVVGLAYYFRERTEEAEEMWLEYTSTGHFVLLYNHSSTRTAITNTIITGVSTVALLGSRIIRTAFICATYRPIARYDQYIRSRPKKWAIYARWIFFYNQTFYFNIVLGNPLCSWRTCPATGISHDVNSCLRSCFMTFVACPETKSPLRARTDGSDDRVTCTKPTHISAWLINTHGKVTSVLYWAEQLQITTAPHSVTATKVGKPEAVTFLQPEVTLEVSTLIQFDEGIIGAVCPITPDHALYYAVILTKSVMMVVA